MHARLLRPDVRGHVPGPQCCHLADGARLLAERLRHYEVKGVAERAQLTAVHLVDGQAYRPCRENPHLS